jgi:hypothetical protein
MQYSSTLASAFYTFPHSVLLPKISRVGANLTAAAAPCNCGLLQYCSGSGALRLRRCCLGGGWPWPEEQLAVGGSFREGRWKLPVSSDCQHWLCMVDTGVSQGCHRGVTGVSQGCHCSLVGSKFHDVSPLWYFMTVVRRGIPGTQPNEPTLVGLVGCQPVLPGGCSWAASSLAAVLRGLHVCSIVIDSEDLIAGCCVQVGAQSTLLCEGFTAAGSWRSICRHGVGHCCEFVANTIAATGRSSRPQMRGVRKLVIGVDNISTCHKGRRCATIRWREGRKVHGIGSGLEKSLRGRLRAWVIGVALLGTSVCYVLSEGVRHECRLPLQSCVCHGVGNPCIVSAVPAMLHGN